MIQSVQNSTSKSQILNSEYLDLRKSLNERLTEKSIQVIKICVWQTHAIYTYVYTIQLAYMYNQIRVYNIENNNKTKQKTAYVIFAISF